MEIYRTECSYVNEFRIIRCLILEKPNVQFPSQRSLSTEIHYVPSGIFRGGSLVRAERRQISIQPRSDRVSCGPWQGIGKERDHSTEGEAFRQIRKVAIILRRQVDSAQRDLLQFRFVPEEVDLILITVHKILRACAEIEYMLIHFFLLSILACMVRYNFQGICS